jgi:uncharacterized protein YjbK
MWIRVPWIKVEEELKFALSLRGYEKLLATATAFADFHQVNHYFETTDRALRKAKAGLRVRIENGRQATLTLKCAVASTAAGAKTGWHRRQEWESRLPLRAAQALTTGRRRLASVSSPVMKALARHLPAIEKDRLHPIGCLQTWRRPIRIGRYAGELDRWQVGDRVFYELEIETHNRRGAEKAVRSLFKQLKIPVRPRASTKLSTFFRLSR